MIERLIYARNIPVAGVLLRQLLLLLSVEVPRQVVLGANLKVEHRGNGLVLSANTKIGDRVRLFHQVGTGTSDNLSAGAPARFAVVIEDDCTIYPGAKIIGGAVPTVVGRGTRVLANAVLTQSTGPNEVWGGVPAKRIHSAA
jgi:serine O-acetyltransferase